jgi:hemerythrin-like domain-containing protein
LQTQHYREQHEKLRKIVEEIPTSVTQVSEAAIRGLMVKFIGTLRAHLGMEDTYLYPAMMEHPDPEIREKARSFKQEMGDLASGIETFYNKWSKAGNISTSPADFVQDWSRTRSVLLNRMDREDRDLYELVDRKVDLRRSA